MTKKLNSIKTGAEAVSVLAVGKGWLVVEKPAGISVHNAPGEDLCSRATAIMKKAPEAMQMIAMNPEFGIHPVHRLDGGAPVEEARLEGALQFVSRI